MSGNALSLFELNNMVRGVLTATLPDRFPLVAELSQVRVAANGHCYVEFVERDERRGTLVAKASGNIWRDTYALLAPRFEQETGQRLRAGLKVLVEVGVTFHELYGYSLNVSDIDASYTLGERERRRREILGRLEEDGVLTLNKELNLPRPLTRIAVISSDTAAGYGDFCEQLRRSDFDFTLRLFPAIMQGDRVEESILAALDDIAAEWEQWDAVAIVRGGGAVSDLDGFDTYMLAAGVAQFPLPVLTGIGHERDNTIIDMVAHTRLKTPTAVAAFLIESRQEEDRAIEELALRLRHAAKGRLSENIQRYETNARRVQLAVNGYVAAERNRLERMMTRIGLGTQRRATGARTRLDVAETHLSHAATLRLARATNRLDTLQGALKMAGPERILKMGFSITMSDGKAVRNAADLRPGDRLVTQFLHGKTVSIVAEKDT